MEDDGDDRWECFEDHGLTSKLGVKDKQEKKPELGDYLRVILTHKSPRNRQERKYKVCLPSFFVVNGYTVWESNSVILILSPFLFGLNFKSNWRGHFGRVTFLQRSKVIKVVTLCKTAENMEVYPYA